MEGVADVFGNAVGTVDLRDPFAHRAEHAAKIDFLEGFAFNNVVANLADEQDQRRGVLIRSVHADRRVGGAGSAGDEGDAGLSGEFAVGIRHIGDAAFLPADDEFEFITALVNGVEHRQVGLAGNAETEIGAVGDQ